MDSDTFNKIAGGVLGALLVFLLLNFASGQIYGSAKSYGGDETLAFAVEIETADKGKSEKKEEKTDYVALLASADAAAGEKAFKKCRSCHKVEDGVNGLGPSLWGVVGRDIGSASGFKYSDGMTKIPGDWTLEKLGEFLKKPREFVKGTTMSFAGIKSAQDRVNLIVWLNNADGTPIELK